jgi:hypothetical protein
MNNNDKLDIACAYVNLEDAIDLLGQYWSKETQHDFVAFNCTDIEKAEEHIHDAMRLLDEFFIEAHKEVIEMGNE